MAACASGSARGYDELLEHHVHVVTEQRLYTTLPLPQATTASPRPPTAGLLERDAGIISAKRALNRLHYQMSVEGFTQVFVDQRDPSECNLQ